MAADVRTQASSFAATARRYADLAGGGDDPRGEVWSAIAHVAELVAQLPPERVASHPPEHMVGWECFGTEDGEVIHRVLGSGHDGRGRIGTHEWPAAEITDGIAAIQISTHGDHPSGAYLHVAGPGEDETSEVFARIRANWPKIRSLIWGTCEFCGGEGYTIEPVMQCGGGEEHECGEGCAVLEQVTCSCKKQAAIVPYDPIDEPF